MIAWKNQFNPFPVCKQPVLLENCHCANSGIRGGVSIEGRPPAPGRDGHPTIDKRWGLPIQGAVSDQTVSPGYFAALGIPLIRGRVFDERHRPDAPMVAVINQAMAGKFFPNEDPIGKRIAIDMTSYAPRMTIVGIVGDVRMDGMDSKPLSELFWPMAQLPTANAWLIARTRGDSGSIVDPLGRVLHGVDPEIGIVAWSTMTSVVGDSLWRQRFSALLLGLFAAFAVLIASKIGPIIHEGQDQPNSILLGLCDQLIQVF